MIKLLLSGWIPAVSTIPFASLKQSCSQVGNLVFSEALPAYEHIRQVVIFGMGGSALAGDLLAAYAAQTSPVAVHLYQQLPVPAWVRGRDTLTIALSYSGDTHDTIEACKQTHRHGCTGLVITQGGELAEMAGELGLLTWQYSRPNPLHASVPFLFGVLLALFHRCGWLPQAAEELSSVINVLDSTLERNHREVAAALNPAKRLAGQLVGCSIAIVGSSYLVPVARSWKVQINTLAKSMAQFEPLLEMANNSLFGSFNPKDNLHRTMVLFLRQINDEPEENLLSDMVRQFYMLQGISTDFVNARGETRLSQIWGLMLFGDLVAYYLAMAYEVDPASAEILADFREALQQRSRETHQPRAQREH